MSIEKIYNIETGETTEVELSDERLAGIAAYQAKIDAEQSEAAIKLEARQAVLEKLGLTADEAALLLS